MENYLNELLALIKSKNKLTALTSSIILPDVCGSLEYPNEASSRKRYTDWFEGFMYKDLTRKVLTGDEAYGMRCVLLHHGENSYAEYTKRYSKSGIILDKFVIYEGPSHLIKVENTKINEVSLENVILVNPLVYSTELIEAAREWLKNADPDLIEAANNLFYIQKTPFSNGVMQIY